MVDRDDGERHDSGQLLHAGRARLAHYRARDRTGPGGSGAQRLTAAAELLKGDRRSVAVRLTELSAKDPASALLELKVCDPAMGSGHFLVSLVGWLADHALAALAERRHKSRGASMRPPSWPALQPSARVSSTRPKPHGWQVTPEQLDDRHVIRRMILKRVVHGVDKNPFAVELAKVALWLHTFTLGAPLSFLDHHLRCGDSIVGAWVRPTLDAVAQGSGLLAGGEVARFEAIAGVMTSIEEITDNDVSEAKASFDAFGTIEVFDLQAGCVLWPDDRAPCSGCGPQPQIEEAALLARAASVRQRRREEDRHGGEAAARLWRWPPRSKRYWNGNSATRSKIATGEVVIAVPDDDGTQPMLAALGAPDQRRPMAAILVADARALTRRERFLHWPVVFPEYVLEPYPASARRRLQRGHRHSAICAAGTFGGAHASTSASYATFAGTADLYVYFFEQGLRLVRPGGRVAYVVTNKWRLYPADRRLLCRCSKSSTMLAPRVMA